MESNGNRNGQDCLFGEYVEMAEKLRTLSFTERFLILENVRWEGVQEDIHRIRGQRYQRMLDHDNAIVAACESMEES